MSGRDNAEACRHCGEMTTQRAQGIPYCSMDCIGGRRREKRMVRLSCPYLDCDEEWEYDPTVTIRKEIAEAEVELHRRDHANGRVMSDV